MELLRTERLLLRQLGGLRSSGLLRPVQAGIDQVLALTDAANVRSQAVAARLGMRDEGITRRWFGLTTRQYRKAVRPPTAP
jgi:RimJ/RimL family protein N-acetyltransferase